MPYLMAALTTGLGFAWKSGIAAEVICQPAQAIGKQLYFSKLYLETPQVFAWTAVVILLSVVLEKALKTGVVTVAKKYGFEGEGTV
jgi:NitT/TauT family transport system permease protein